MCAESIYEALMYLYVKYILEKRNQLSTRKQARSATACSEVSGCVSRCVYPAALSSSRKALDISTLISTGHRRTDVLAFHS